MLKKFFTGAKRSVAVYSMKLNMQPGAFYLFSRKFPATERKDRLWIHILLFVITFATTTLVGAHESGTLLDSLISGLEYSIPLLLILMAHEMGHYLAARHFGVRATLPYFIPFPLPPIGTMGAVIKIKSPIPDKRALLYIGALGPLAGFVFSLIFAIIGIYMSKIMPLPAAGTGETTIFGNSLLYSLLVKVMHGQIPAGHDIFLSPFAWAGWIGFLVTALNLMPMGQLDGSHIVYALFGRKQLVLGWSMFGALIILSFFWPGWILWIVMALVFLMIGHPPVEDGNELTLAEKAMGWACIIIFIITFIPVPVELI